MELELPLLNIIIEDMLESASYELIFNGISIINDLTVVKFLNNILSPFLITEFNLPLILLVK